MADMDNGMVCVGECMLEISGPTDKIRVSCAGDTLNTAIYLSRLLGPGKVSYVTRLGDDPHSEMMVETMAGEGVDTSLVTRVPGRLPGLYTITLDEGERAFHYWRSEAPVRQMLSEPEQGLRSALENASCLYATGITLAVLGPAARDRLLCCAKNNPNGLSYALNNRASLWSVENARHWHVEAAKVASILFASTDDLEQVWPDGDGLERLVSICAGVVVLTKGSEGCEVIRGGRTIAKGRAPRAKVVDTTAAGDSFAAAFLAARISGEDYGVCSKRACELASAVVGHHGAIIPRADMPYLSR